MIQRMSQLITRTRVLVIVAAIFVVAVPAASAADVPPPVTDLGSSSSPSGATCRSYSIKVLQSATSTNRQSVWAQRCYTGSLTASKPVQLLIHGGGYNHVYWDSPNNPGGYSYVKQATTRGYVTLNIDRLGNGNSDHPDPTTLTMQTGGYVAHQVVTALKAGKLGPAFSKVILNGHSMGAAEAQNEAENWNDVNGLIVSGVGHLIDPRVQQTVGSKLYPAEFDPKFAGQPWAPGYLTTLPGQRAPAFILPGIPQPGVIPVEEGIMKDVLTQSQLVSLFQDSYDPTLTPKIKVPVDFVQGQYDQLWCLRTGDCNTDPVSGIEYTFYAPTTSFTRVVIPQAGHSINTSVTAPVFYTQTFAWLASKGLN